MTKILAKVIPKSRRSEVKIDGDVIKVWLHAPPIEGRANEELILILAEKLGLPKTSEPAVHATPKMAEQVRRALNDTNARDLGILVMNGPGDGVISFSSDPNVAGSILLEKLVELDDFFKRLGT